MTESISFYCNGCSCIPTDVRMDVYGYSVEITCKQCGESERFHD